MPLFQPDNLDARVLSQFSLSGKTALVTGGSRGIGRQIVTGLAEAGADVAFIYRTATDATQTASEVAKATGVRVQAYQSDVTNKDEITRTIEQIAATFGKGQLDIVIANAGVCQNVPSLEYDEDTWKYMNSVNYDGVMWTALAAGRLFKKQGRGKFIITASVSATLVNVPQTQAAYNASKAGVVQLAKSLAVEWVDFARVNCVSPGYIMTEMLTRQPKELLDIWVEMIPGRRTCAPQELKGACVSKVMTSRIDLHNELKRKATAADGNSCPAKLHRGSAICHVDPEAATLTLTDGRKFSGDVIIAADGIHSKTRDVVTGDKTELVSTGKSCYRCITPISDIRQDPVTAEFVESPGTVIEILGEDRSIIFYPCSDNKSLYTGAFVPTTEVGVTREDMGQGGAM
ncbi:hypothetical protein SLS57_010962 [Botryosphaeria dothidea]